MRNIQFNYRYRDGGNYKVNGFVIFSNPQNLSISLIEKEIRNYLIDTEFFDPDEFSIPKLKHLNFPYDPELDYSWNEFNFIEETENVPTDHRSIREFIDFITKASERNSI